MLHRKSAVPVLSPVQLPVLSDLLRDIRLPEPLLLLLRCMDLRYHLHLPNPTQRHLLHQILPEYPVLRLLQHPPPAPDLPHTLLLRIRSLLRQPPARSPFRILSHNLLTVLSPTQPPPSNLSRTLLPETPRVQGQALTMLLF